jgi:hypothetical protein
MPFEMGFVVVNSEAVAAEEKGGRRRRGPVGQDGVRGDNSTGRQCHTTGCGQMRRLFRRLFRVEFFMFNVGFV